MDSSILKHIPLLLISILFLFNPACDDDTISSSDENSLIIQIKLERDPCRPPDETCSGNVIQVCRPGLPYNYWEDSVDCAATGQTCGMSARSAQCE